MVWAKGPNSILLHIAILLSQHHLLERLFFPLLNDLDTLVENQLTIDVWVYFWNLDVVPLIYISVFMPIPHRFDYPTFEVSFKIGVWVFSLRSYLYCGPLSLHRAFCYCLIFFHFNLKNSSISYRADWLDSLLFLKNSFARFLVNFFFPFSSLNVLSHCFLASMVSDMKQAILLMIHVCDSHFSFSSF